MKKVWSNRLVALLVVVAAGFSVVLSGCDEAGAGSGDSALQDPSDVDFDAAFETIAVAAENISDPGVSLYVMFGSVYFGIFALYIDAWDGSGSYSYGGVTVTVTEGNGVWTWEYSDGTDSIVYEITATSSGWDFSWTQNGDLFISGSISTDGLTGTLSFYDVGTGALDFTYTLESGVGSFDLRVTLAIYESGAVTDTVVVETTLDGTEGTWTYTDASDSGNDSTGSWDPTTAASAAA